MSDVRPSLSVVGMPAPNAMPGLPGIGEAEAIRRLQAVVAAQARIISEQATSLSHSRKIFDRAAAAARIGVWECDLADDSLRWTDGVYDIFGFPRGGPVDRETTLSCYEPCSAAELERLRARAIAEGGGFSLDAEITRVDGERRWIRITATVECEEGRPARIFGMKQDITEEKLLTDRMRHLAEFDAMTGLANRQRFQSRLEALDDGAMPAGTLLLVDLDGFKRINDTHGHAVGDACLVELARRLKDACGPDLECFRIGGDEFAVFVDAREAQDLAGRIVEALGRPVAEKGATLLLGASVGVAHHGAGLSGSELFTHADTALYAAKAAGRGTFRTFAQDEAGV